MQPQILRINRTLIGVAAIGAIALLQAVGSVSTTHAAGPPPASCNALITKYFGAQNGSRVPFNLVHQGMNTWVSYREGFLTLSTTSGEPSLAAEHVTQYFNVRRNALGQPFDPAQADGATVRLTKGAVEGLNLEIIDETWGNRAEVTPLGCVGDNLLYGIFNEGTVSLVLSDPQPLG